jgi:hypothetical protein
MILMVLGGIAALVFGFWLGSPARYERNLDEIEEAIDKERPRRQAKRHFTFLNAYLNRKAPPRARKRHQPRRTPFSGLSGQAPPPPGGSSSPSSPDGSTPSGR